MGEYKNLKKPKIIKILKKQIKYRIKNDDQLYSISKNKLKIINTDNPNKLVYHRHKINLNINGKFLKGELWLEVEDAEIVNEVINLIYLNNLHWSMNILTEDQMKSNIHDVFNISLGKFSFIKSPSC